MAKRTSKVKSKIKKATIVAAGIAVIAGSVAVIPRVISPYEKVLSVIDGDSFKIGRDQTVRLSSLDAPEEEYCAGKDSKKALSGMIDGKKVFLKELKTDRYGRVMAMVYLPSGENINEYMIKNGLALHIWDTSSQNEILDKANDFARENKLGIFSAECFQENPPDPKCVIKGNVIQHTGSKEYTLPSCKLYNNSLIEKYKGEDWFCTEAEAKDAGFVKSKNCE